MTQTNILTSCSLSGQTRFLRVTAPCWTVPIVCRVPRHCQTQVQIAVCTLQVSRHTKCHRQQVVFQLLYSSSHTMTSKRRSTVLSYIHFQIIWLRFHVRTLQHGRLRLKINCELRLQIFADAFAKLRKVTVIIVMTVCLSVWPFVCPSAWKPRGPTGGIFVKFDIWGFSFSFWKNCRENSSFI